MKPAVRIGDSWIAGIGDASLVGVGPYDIPPENTITNFLLWWWDEHAGPGGKARATRERGLRLKRKERELIAKYEKKVRDINREQSAIYEAQAKAEKRIKRINWLIDREDMYGLISDIAHYDYKVEWWNRKIEEYQDRIRTIEFRVRWIEHIPKRTRELEGKIRRARKMRDTWDKRRRAAQRQMERLVRERTKLQAEITKYDAVLRRKAKAVSELVIKIRKRRARLESLYGKYGRYGRRRS